MKKQPEAKQPEVSHPFRDARRASVPLVQYETSDPAATISNCLAALNGSSKDTPVLQWDLGRLLQPVNQAGADVITELSNGEQDPKSISNPAEFLSYLVKPESLRALRKAILFIHNAHRPQHHERHRPCRTGGQGTHRLNRNPRQTGTEDRRRAPNQRRATRTDPAAIRGHHKRTRQDD